MGNFATVWKELRENYAQVALRAPKSRFKTPILFHNRSFVEVLLEFSTEKKN